MLSPSQRFPQAAIGGTAGVAGEDGLPIPLAAERMRITIRGPLALVSREQVFRNVEKESIEATVTFPVPVHATLCRLTARIGERVLTARARARDEARASYETAVDEGKTAVLHEELLRGIHSLSIAHIPPGSEVAVTHAWIAALSPRGEGRALLRIPVTVGDVYGDSPLSDADDLSISRSVLHEAEVEIDAGSAKASLLDRPTSQGPVRLRLDQPVDVEVYDIEPGAVRGLAADGRPVCLTVLSDAGDGDIDAVILVDRSGSMADPVAGRKADRRTRNKHQAVLSGLAEAARAIRRRDRIELWQFDSAPERICGSEVPLADAIRRLAPPAGGTEIGKALQAAIEASGAGDILLITDGLSHALDVQRLARSGKRFTVVLVGEDSLEANVGRLAALTGGQIVPALGTADVAEAVAMAIASLRRRRPAFETAGWPMASASMPAGGAILQARWDATDGLAVEPAFESAVGALAASIALPRLDEKTATQVALEHGLVSHLTSLVLVDEAGAVQETLPAQRKVPLMESRVSAAMPVPCAHEMGRLSLEPCKLRWMPMSADLELTGTRPPRRLTLHQVAKRMDWGTDPEALRRGDLSGLPAELADPIRTAAGSAEVRALAGPGGNAIAIVIALMARSLGWASRGARRIAKAVLEGRDGDLIAKAMSALGL